MKIKPLLITATFILTAFALLVSGCSFDRWAEVNGGDYIPVYPGTRGHDYSVVDSIEHILINRDEDIVQVFLRNGDIIEAAFTARHEEGWPSGCPANLGSTKMEVLDLDVSELTIGSLVLSNPVLVRNCPRQPETVILREDGMMGGSSTACAGNDICIHLKPGTPSEPMQSPRELTRDERNLVHDIAVSGPEIETYLEGGSSFHTELRWMARITGDSGDVVTWNIDYDWQSDGAFSSVPSAAIWNPAALITFDAPGQEQILVAVDMDRERIVQIWKNPGITGVISGPPRETPDITGRITDIQASTGSSTEGRVLVELDENDGTSDKYWVSIGQDTRISDYRRGTREIMSFPDLETGLQVQVWFSGPVREPYPTQVDAAQMDIVLDEGFAIYFLDETILPYEMPALSHIELPEDPVISGKDILSYSNMTHEIELTPEAYERIQALEPPRVFVVSVGRQPVYWGTFWANWFSRSIEDGVVILKPLSQDRNVIQIDLGYPAGMFLIDEDPRSNPVILKSLERSGIRMNKAPDYNDLVITLERTPCYGFCPVYTLTIRGDGTVVYEGKDFVQVKGKAVSTISQEQIEQLVAEFEKADYFSLNDSYTERTITDAPSVITSITIDGKTKSIEHYHGDFSAPEPLTHLEDRIDEIVDSSQWIE